MKKKKLGYVLLIFTAIIAVVALYIQNPILQDVKYHDFSDKREFLTLNNFLNVASNLPFVFVGIYGLFISNLSVKKSKAYLIFYIGLILVFFGSSYYHINPNNETLIWDRLPMTVSFMALFSMVISEFIDRKIGENILVPLLLFGLFSIFYWVHGNTHDLRPYILVQFYPIIAIPIIISLFKSNHTPKGYWILIAFYFAAKLFEYFDYQIHSSLSFISGHSLKHIFAGIGLYILTLNFKKNKNGQK